ncbi:MAG: hypothetical protein WBA93_36780 [Microcoleaceae cyanobacterium]
MVRYDGFLNTFDSLYFSRLTEPTRPGATGCGVRTLVNWVLS